jgi:hypothetical protein
MDEEITIIDSNTRNEKIKKFLIENKKLLISIAATFIFVIISFYSFQEYQKKQKQKIANKYNGAVIEYENGNQSKIILLMKEIIKDKDKTYSPLALYFLIDNNLKVSNQDINILFDILIEETNTEAEIKNLLIYKKALFNSDFASENDLLKILGPIINSENIWKSHALYLMAEYFYYKNEKKKSEEFFNQILMLPNSNSDIKAKSQKRINRDFSE